MNDAKRLYGKRECKRGKGGKVMYNYRVITERTTMLVNRVAGVGDDDRNDDSR